ncbi:unnamed protein product [Tetraodon nigroviridis]|uniref:(spotted green pufferfish) hypothetical protein n=1 Tax=Tetraodon nigroviridis TaxID=99883 RepID=Q4RPL2_TETNG|nr:unnamed protein product [Tetraodon nigroviridis]
MEEQQRYERPVGDPLQAFDPEQQEGSGRRKPALVRSKTFDHSLLTHIPTDSDPKIERKKPQCSQISKGNSQYHKIFKEISKEEQLIQSYTCALQKDILYQGRMFVSDHWICFHSKVFGKDTKIAIPVMSVAHIKKTKTAILVPNALVIATARDKVRRSRLRNQDWEKNEREILIRLFFCGFCPVRVCVLPVPRQHLQNPDVHLSSSWRRRVHAAAPFPPRLTTASGVRGHPTSIWSVFFLTWMEHLDRGGRRWRTAAALTPKPSTMRRSQNSPHLLFWT